MKKSIIIILCCISIATKAQVNCYLTAGTSHGINLSETSQPGYNIGGIIDLYFSKSWSFQTGLTFNKISTDNNSSNSTRNDIIYEKGSTTNYHFIELPVAASFSIGFSETCHLKFNTGAYLSIFTGGNTLYRAGSGIGQSALYPTISDPIGGGFLIGTGIEVKRLYIGFEANLNIPDGYKPNTVLKTKIGIKI